MKKKKTKINTLPVKFTKQQHEIFTKHFYKVYPLCSMWDDMEKYFYMHFHTSHSLQWLAIYGEKAETDYLAKRKYIIDLYDNLYGKLVFNAERELIDQMAELIGIKDDDKCGDGTCAKRPEKREVHDDNTAQNENGVVHKTTRRPSKIQAWFEKFCGDCERTWGKRQHV